MANKKYDKGSCRELMHLFVRERPMLEGEIVELSEIRDWFEINYSDITVGAVAAHVAMMTVNGQKRYHHVDPGDGLDDLFYRVDHGKYRLYVLGVDEEPPARN
jgi:hypothetical protein